MIDPIFNFISLHAWTGDCEVVGVDHVHVHVGHIPAQSVRGRDVVADVVDDYQVVCHVAQLVHNVFLVGHHVDRVAVNHQFDLGGEITVQNCVFLVVKLQAENCAFDCQNIVSYSEKPQVKIAHFMVNYFVMNLSKMNLCLAYHSFSSNRIMLKY